MKKGILVCSLILAIFALESNVKRVTSSNFPPTNCTGAPNTYTCAGCHHYYATNMTGGGIIITGIPTNFAAGQSYPFSITIKHFAKDRKKFGYDVTALDALGNTIGTFSTTNPNSTVERFSGELTSHDPIALNPTDQSTISGFTWNAPKKTPTTDQLPITFYFCGNACDGNGTVSGDYVYNDSIATTLGTLPVGIDKFVAVRKSDNVADLSWSFANESIRKKYIVQKSLSGVSFFDIDSLVVKNNSFPNNRNTYSDYNIGSKTTVFYRIKIIAKDGSVSFSTIKSLNPIFHIEATRLYPNPMEKSNQLTMEFISSQNGFCNVSVVNFIGKMEFTTKKNIVIGKNAFSIPVVQRLFAGTYFVIVSSEGSILEKQKFIVK